MLKSTIRLLPAMACFTLAGFASLCGQTTPAPAPNTAATNAPSATPPVTPIALGDIVSQAQTDTTKLQEDRAGLNPDQTLRAIEAKLPGLTGQIDTLNTEDAQLLAATPTLDNLQSSQKAWQSLSDDTASAQKDLSQRVQQLNTLLWQLSRMDDAWKATTDAAKKANAPPEIVQRVQQVRALFSDTTKAVQAALAPLYSMQNRVAAQDARIATGLDTVNKAVDTARTELFKQNHPALWNPEAISPAGGGVAAQEKASLHRQLAVLKIYLVEKIGAVLIHLFLIALFVMGFYWTRNTIQARAREEPALQHAARVFDVPLATALLFALLATWFLYPEAPRLLRAVAGATALIPAVIIIRRLIEPANFPLLYATVIAYFVDQLRYVVTPSGILSRFLLILELLAAAIFILIMLRSNNLSPSQVEQTRLKRNTRIYLHVAFVVFVFAGFANVFGYVHLAVLIGNGMLESSYLAVVFYAAVSVADALAISALSIRPLAGLRMVRRNHDLLYDNIATAIRWLAVALWLVAALQLFTLRDPLWQDANSLLWTRHQWFSIKFSLGAVLAFPITVWASFLLSRFVRFALEEEVYTHLQLGRGIPYAASTMVHYTILLVGFFAAVAATGTQLSQFAFLAGAFGVGLGFGLQNIMNNFVSGVILLFERPIKVGDVVQIDPATMGTVERIGIRASVILLANGAEVIVPNGNLISNPVTNWTLSNCERLIEIPVTVASKVDPETIINLLTHVAGSHPDVLKNPAPRAYLVAFAGASLTFRLSAWIDSAEQWMKITSDLSLAINAALAKENIAIS